MLQSCYFTRAIDHTCKGIIITAPLVATSSENFVAEIIIASESESGDVGLIEGSTLTQAFGDECMVKQILLEFSLQHPQHVLLTAEFEVELYFLALHVLFHCIIMPIRFFLTC